MKGLFKRMRILMLTSLFMPTSLLMAFGVPCGSAPFECGDLTFEFKAGVAPKRWTGRDCILGVTNGTLRDVSRIPNFSCLHKVPWLVGLKLGRLFSCNIEFYLEFDYIQANSKHFNFAHNDNNVSLRNLGKLQEYTGYLGSRYYFNRMFCDTTAWFVGSKVGVSHHRSRCGGFHFGFNDFSADTNGNVFNSHTSISGGVHAGFDVRMWCGLSFVFTAEVLASSGPRGLHVPLTHNNSNVALNHLSIGSVGSEVTFPVTFGLMYTF